MRKPLCPRPLRMSEDAGVPQEETDGLEKISYTQNNVLHLCTNFQKHLAVHPSSTLSNCRVAGEQKLLSRFSNEELRPGLQSQLQAEGKRHSCWAAPHRPSAATAPKTHRGPGYWGLGEGRTN